MEPEWLRIDEAARYLNVSVRFLKEERAKERIEYCKFGGSLRFHKNHLDYWAHTKRGGNPKAPAVKFAKKRKFKFVR